MKNTIVALAVLAVAVLAAVPEDAEAGRRGGGRSGGSKRLKIPSYNVPSVPIVTPKFSRSQERTSKSSNNRVNGYPPPYTPPNQASDTLTQNQGSGRVSWTKKDCLDIQWKLKSEPENVQFMCSYLGVR